MAGLVVLQAAQLGFITPNGLFGSLEPGSQVNVSWTSPWPLTTLEIWRGPSQDDGSYNVDVLGANLTSSTTSYPYQVPGASSEENAFSPQVYFRLQKSDLPNQCENCVASSPTFQIAAAGAALPPSVASSASEATSASSPATAATTPATTTESESATSVASEAASSTSAEAGSSTAAEAESTTTADAAVSTTEAASSMETAAATSMAESTAESTAETAPSGMTTMVSSTLADTASTTSAEPFTYTLIGSQGFDRATTLGLGVGLGVGIPVLLAIMALLVVCLNRRERRRIQEKQFEGVFPAQ